MEKRILLSLVVLLAVSELAPAATRQVPDDYDTIQDAINAAVDGDIVIVEPNTYTGLGNRDIEVTGKSITVRSANGPENCIIDCNGSRDEPHIGFYFHGISSSSNLSGFTVTNGYSEKIGGSGGIVCNGANVTISDCNISGNTILHGRGGSGGGISVMDGIYLINNCTISNNSAEFPGSGGISCQNSALTVNNCTINGNSGYYGGGIGSHHGYDNSLSINNCTFSDNSASYGGGIFCCWASSIISNCTFTGNEAYRGGAISIGAESIYMINNCMISNNSADEGGGVYCFTENLNYVNNSMICNCTLAKNSANSGGGVACWSANLKLTNCIVWDNWPEQISVGSSSVTYSNVQGSWQGQGNIDIDPCFADPCSGDYHLPLGSPCINAGDPCYVPSANETDLDGNPRITAGRIDMGAYEFSYIESRLRILPQVINRHSRMKRIMAWVHLPEGVSKEQVDEDEGVLLYPGGIEPVRQYVFEHGKKGDKRVSIFAFYDKSELMGAIPDNGEVELEVVGNLTTGQQFYGSGFVTIIGRQQPRQWRLLKNQ